ncbi:hypothetical protein GE061_008947 [Apolygus lucorum]|uniref:Nucleoporin NUP35 n=1 Tax=Apolygus lucorum TaxID=248454 RepID=A0A6A4KGJ6_APOLU|nr:hypothetical protein GE061_008947 [Apolygus lucorum]
MAGSTSPPPFAQNRPNYGRNAKPTASGPPTLSLYDVLEDNSITESKENQPTERSEVLQPSSAENSEGHWVMVYGFPPSASAHITSHFSQIGFVKEWSFPATGNWMFVKYATRSDARKALSFDGRVINGDIMIGVREGKNITQLRTAYPTTPTLQNSSLLNRTTGSPGGVMSPKIRNLGTPRRSLSLQQTLDTSNAATPTSPSVASKVMDWFAGW